MSLLNQKNIGTNMLNADVVNISIGIASFLFFLWAIIISFYENEKKAALRMLLVSIIITSLFLIPVFYHFLLWFEYSVTLWSFAGIFFLVILFPITDKKHQRAVPNKRFDERDTVFARRRLKIGTERYSNYYSDKPELKKSDSKLFCKSGLLKKESKYFNPFQFAAAEASFETVERLYGFIDGKHAKDLVNVDEKQISRFIKNWSKKLGAIECGITNLRDYHLYSHNGNDEHYGNLVINNHKFAIAFTAEMDKVMMDSAPQGSVVMESAQQYLNPGTVAVQVASFIRNLGYEASAHIDGNYDVICPLVARDAGLGEIGRMGVLMTPKQGPRVRISVVTTNIPLIIDNVKFDSSIDSFCSICKKCSESCPSKAIPSNAKMKIDGVNRWKINPDACLAVWNSFGTDCGKCMAVCPYSHPNNLFHNTIRFGIKHFPLFRYFALWMDDFFYGRKPKTKKLVEWMDIHNPN